MKHKTILRVVSKILIPFILLFAFYTQFHGDYGPGGGFQAGVIAAAAFVLYGLIFGLEETRRVLPDRTVEILVASGVLLYAGVGFATMLLGGNFLDYDVLVQSAGHGHEGAHDHRGQHLGILLVELGVGITVTSVMVAIFAAFAGRAEQEARG